MKKDLHQENIQNAFDGKSEEKEQRDKLNNAASVEMESTVTEGDENLAASPTIEEGEPSQRGASEMPAVAAEAAPPTLEEWQDRFLRLAADFANYKRRTEQERLEFADHVRRELLAALLPVLDDFDLMMEYDSAHPERLAEGARLIRQKMRELLSKQGLEKIEALNQPFDYERHEAVLTQPVKDKAFDHVVLSVMQDGYLFKDKVLRPSKVIVGEYAENQLDATKRSDVGGTENEHDGQNSTRGEQL